MKRSVVPFALILCLSAALSLQAEELRLSLDAQAAGLDPRLWSISPVALGGVLGVEVEGLFREELAISLGASYLGFLPVMENPPLVHGIHGILGLSWLWGLGRGGSLGPYADFGYGTCLASLPAEGEPWVGGQIRPALGVRWRQDLTESLALSLRLGCFSLVETGSAWFNLEFRAGLSIRLAEWKRGPGPADAEPVDPEAARLELSSRSDMRIIEEGAAAGGSLGGLEGQRLVI